SEAVRPPERAGRLERRALATPPHPVAIRARACVEAGMEARWRRLGRHDGYVAGQLRIQRRCGALSGRPALHVDRHDVGERVHARVGPPCDRELVRTTVETLQGTTHLAL